MAAQFGRRLYRGAATTAVAAAAVAALSASQAPGSPLVAADGEQPAAGATTPGAGSGDGSVSGDSPYYTDLPPLNTPEKTDTSAVLPVTGSAESGIPASVLAAYKKAERTVAGTDAACRLPWQLLAAIGKVESGQARGGKVDAQGTTLTPILGPALNGQGFALIKDTDNGAYDGDREHDRAVGPMQFIPSTWEVWGQDGNGDGRKDPNNIYDAALAAGRYLCAGSRDLSTATDLDRAVLSYNHSDEYLRTVRSWFEYYNRGTHEVPDGTGVLPSGPTSRDPGSGSSHVGGGPSKSPSPTPSPKPGGSTKPKPPSEPSPEPSAPGDLGKPTSPTPTPAPTPSETVTGLRNAGTGALTATAGDPFAERIKVRAHNGLGGAVAKTSVTFKVTGDTDATFAGGGKTATVATGTDGTATAPVLEAGEKTGGFTVLATATGTSLAPVTYTATVTARQADALARTGTEELTALAGETFEDIAVAATYKGETADRVAVTATMITGGLLPVENDKGPYLTDDNGDPVRSIVLTTDADGKLTLPKVYADGPAGTYKLRLTTEGGADLVIELTVEERTASAAS
ncbi:lytic transglycosylase domain-containing protein [Streptomyces castrisilvae]|uniref:Lytic transglycosylase domain-containing protein n=1 Tax=Streptomyces castrisilvae TaxID=3033811 RepID=A0ABY9HFY8_9ACTN|nr:lytic transglycosylase domain-containing protein [Streptomyces sp. Mut1]WLQ33221.1 lytic transglycosylase domain-containing protein [Streptomyces sp. Mut1]